MTKDSSTFFQRIQASSHYLRTFFSILSVLLLWLLGLLLPWLLICGYALGNFFTFHPPHNLFLLLFPEVPLLCCVLLLGICRRLWSWLDWRFDLFPLTMDDIIYYNPSYFSSYVGFFPYLHQWLGLWLILWGVPIYMAIRSYHLRSTYLPESWDPLTLVHWFPSNLGEFLLPLVCLSLPLILACWELLKYRSQFFLSLQVHYFWLLVRLNFTPLGKVFKFYDDSVHKYSHAQLKNSNFIIRFLPHTHWLYELRTVLWIWIVLLPLDLWVHRGLLVWSLSFLPYWAGLLLVWRSFVFLLFNFSHLDRWTDYFYGPPKHYSRFELREFENEEVGLYYNRGHSLRCLIKYRSIYAKKKKNENIYLLK